MSKIFVVVFLIFGTVVGAGFSSGTEIMIFFSRFGPLSYLYIMLAGCLMFWIFYFFLTNNISHKLEKSKVLNGVIFAISLVFCASMFAGVNELFFYLPTWCCVLCIIGILLLSLLITFKGHSGLEKANIILMPVITVCFLVVLVYSMGVSSSVAIETNAWAGILYSPLYVCLNTSMGGLVISKAGEELSKKQAFWVSLISCLLLVGFLLLGNFVLQQNLNTIASDMPFLTIVENNKFMFALIYIVILVGCFTTLISLTVTLKSAFDKFCRSELFSTILAVFMPFLISIVGFAEIVSMLYPLCSVLGIFVLFYFIFSKYKN